MIIKEEDDTTEEVIDYCDNETESIDWHIGESNEEYNECNKLDNYNNITSLKAEKDEAPKKTRRKKGEPPKKLEKIFQCEQCDYKCEHECKKNIFLLSN